MLREWGWRITEALINPEHAGLRMKQYKGGRHRYRIKDSEGTIYYYIFSDINPETGTKEEMSEPLRWAEYMLGCTVIECYLEGSGWSVCSSIQ